MKKQEQRMIRKALFAIALLGFAGFGITACDHGQPASVQEAI